MVVEIGDHCITLDPDSIRLIRVLFTAFGAASAEHRADARYCSERGERGSLSGQRHGSMPGTSQTPRPGSSGSSKFLFRSLEVKSTWVSLDAQPHGVDKEALTGDIIELFALIPIKDLILRFPRVSRLAVFGIDGAVEVVMDTWVSYLKTNAHLCFSAVDSTLLPVRALSNITAEVWERFQEPLPSMCSNVLVCS